MSINNFDWQKIETFDEKVEWQKSLAIEVHNMCYNFAYSFGKEDRKKREDKTEPNITTNLYNDDIVQIYCSSIYFYNGGMTRLTCINLVPLNTAVFSVTFIGNAQPYYNIPCFRLGSWLNHIESLRLKLELIDKAEEEKRNRNRERQFRRLD